jgi:hypothetical protein
MRRSARRTRSAPGADASPVSVITARFSGMNATLLTRFWMVVPSRSAPPGGDGGRVTTVAAGHAGGRARQLNEPPRRLGSLLLAFCNSQCQAW